MKPVRTTHTNSSTNKKPRALKSVYLIHGDKKMIEDGIARLKKRISDQFDLDFNFDQFRGSETSASEIIYAANTLPFMSDKRLVIVKEIDKMQATEVQKLIEYIENPSEMTCLVLVATSVNKASKLLKAVERYGEIAEYKLKESSQTWIKHQFAARHKVISDAVARYLLRSVGNDLERLAVEIEKISLYYPGNQIVDPADIEAVVSQTSEASIFDLGDKIGERNTEQALKVVRLLIEQKEPPLGILALLSRHMRLLLRTKVWLEKGKDVQYIVQHLTGDDGKKLPAFVVSKYKEQSYNFTIGELKNIFEMLLQADIALKTSAQAGDAVLEDLVVSVGS